MPVVPITVETEVGKIMEVAAAIHARRQDRKDEAWADLDDDLEAIGTVVQLVNRLYRNLLEEIQWIAAGEEGIGGDVRQRLVEEVHSFLHDDQLIGTLTELHGKIQAASQEPKLSPSKRRLSSTLRGLERSLDDYLGHLRGIQEGGVHTDSAGAPLWNLAIVLDCLERGESESGLPLRDLCEEAIRNRRSDLVYAIEGMVGQARHQVSFRRA